MNETTPPADEAVMPENGHMRLRRDSGPIAWVRNNWHRRRVRWSAYLIGYH